MKGLQNNLNAKCLAVSILNFGTFLFLLTSIIITFENNNSFANSILFFLAIANLLSSCWNIYGAVTK